MSERPNFRRPIFRAVASSEAERARRTYTIPPDERIRMPITTPEVPQRTFDDPEHYVGHLMMMDDIDAAKAYEMLGEV